MMNGITTMTNSCIYILIQYVNTIYFVAFAFLVPG